MSILTKQVLSLLFMAGIIFLSCKNEVHPIEGQTSENTQPNIIYILADDLGYAEVGAYGQEKI